MNNFKEKYWLYAFVILHLVCWTVIPALIRHNLPLDAIEGTLWGHQLEWGYDKNPFMNAWLTALAVQIGGHSDWVIYLFSQLSVAVCFVSIWLIAKSILPPAEALLSILLLEGVQYYHLHAIDFNDNTLELGLWGLTCLFFYKAVRERRLLFWLLTGLLAGLSLMTKYYALALFAGMGLFLLRQPEARKSLQTKAPYLALLVLVIVSLPHIFWLFQHDFITVAYVFKRGASSSHSWYNHLFYPAQFAWQQLQVFIPSLILFASLFIGKRPLYREPALTITTFDQRFLLYVGLGPFLLTLLLSLLLGTNLRAGWGMPLMSLWGVILFAEIQPRLSLTKMYSFITLVFVLMAALLSAYTLSLVRSNSGSSANFPGATISETVNAYWEKKYHQPLAYLAGSRWLGGNVSYYSAKSPKPAVFTEWDHHNAPWINTDDIKRRGAVFIWDIDAHETLPKSVQAAYPQLTAPEVLEFEWLRNQHHLQPIKIGIAFLPPENAS